MTTSRLHLALLSPVLLSVRPGRLVGRSAKPEHPVIEAGSCSRDPGTQLQTLFWRQGYTSNFCLTCTLCLRGSLSSKHIWEHQPCFCHIKKHEIKIWWESLLWNNINQKNISVQTVISKMSLYDMCSHLWSKKHALFFQKLKGVIRKFINFKLFSKATASHCLLS